MSSSSPRSVALAPHPAGVHEAVRAIEAKVRRDSSGLLVVRYTVHGDPRSLVIPPARAPGRADGLWRHTCFEAFIAPGVGPSYLELNFSPSGEWASYEFGSYRERRMADREPSGPVTPVEAPSITRIRGDDALTVEAAVTLQRLGGEMPVKMALAAVIEDARGTLSYWALRHPPGKPDFHHPDGFVLQI
jgi:hypothetical protein